MTNKVMLERMHVAAESAWETDPSADGSGYLAILHDGPVNVSMDVDLVEYNAANGLNVDIQPDAGRQFWEMQAKFHLHGLAAAVGDGASVGAADALGILLTNAFGTRNTVAGEGVASVGSATAITLDSDVIDAGEMLIIAEDSVPTPERAQPQYVATDGGAGAYSDLSPGFEDFGTAPPTGAAVAYGHELFVHDPSAAEPASLAFVTDDGTDKYVLLGGNWVACRIVVPENRAKSYIEGTIRGTSWTRDSGGAKTSLPSHGTSTPAPVIQGRRSPVHFGGTAYGTPAIEIDLGIVRAEVNASRADHGMSGMQRTFGPPTVTITPEYSATVEEWKKNATSGVLMCQLGAGSGASGGVLNMLAMCFPNASVQSSTPQNQNNIKRKQIVMKPNAAAQGSYHFMMARG